VVQAIFGSGSSKSRYALADADAWSYLAPIANVLAAWWLLGDRQHERFVTGVTRVSLAAGDPSTSGGAVQKFRAKVALSKTIAADHFADFETFSDVPAVATFGAIRATGGGAIGAPHLERLRARVRGGELGLGFDAVPLPAEVEILWMVDTAKPKPALAGS
jgi:hypothetical protein